MSRTECPTCGKVYDGHMNVYGKICLYCGSFIEPDIVQEMVKNNVSIKEKYSTIAIDKIREKLLNEEGE